MTAKKRTERKRANEMKPKKSTSSRRWLLTVVILIGLIAVVSGIIFVLYQPSNNGKVEDDTIVIPEHTYAILNTSKGIIKIELFPDKVPLTVRNFMKLAKEGFYDGMIFHRVMDDFMIQAGNTYPDGSTKESPYGTIQFESTPDLSHEDGSISMASTGAGVGGSAQFFICDGAQPDLDGSYAVFGKTVEGIEVVRDIADEPHDSSYGSVGGGRPLEDVIIYSITIE